MFRFIKSFIFSLLFFFGHQISAQQILVIADQIGLDPSGKNDNSQIINKLIDSIASLGGGKVIVPKGNFLLDEAVILKSFVTISGASQSETIFFRRPDSGSWSDTKAQGLFTTNPQIQNQNIIIENLSVNGYFQKNSTGGKAGICLRNTSNSIIRKITTHNTWHGVAFYDFKGENSRNLIDSVTVFDAHTFTTKNNSGRPRGVLVMDSGSTISNSISFRSGTGFYAQGSNINLINNHAETWFEDNGYYLIVDNLTVSNCVAKGGATPEKGFGSGFAIAYRKGALIENCTAINCSNYGFRIHVPQSDTQLINNQAVGCGNGFGIETASHPFPEVSTNLLFKDNKAEKSGLHGFLFRQMTNSKIIRNQAINGNQRGVTLSTRGAIALKEHLFENTFEGNECIDNQFKKTQIYGLYDFSVRQITNEAKKGKNNKIKHRSKNGIDEF